jgi:hypothetical protein
MIKIYPIFPPIARTENPGKYFLNPARECTLSNG